jgi:hypothetical protein
MRAAFLCIWLCLGYCQFGEAAGEITPTVFTGADAGQFIPVAESTPIALGEILHLSTSHLFALGAGIVIGATVLVPQLEVGELTGIIIGVIVGDLFYRAFLAPQHSWFPEDLF